MNYIEKEYKDFSIKAQVSNFSVEGGITEYQVMLAVTDPMLSFAEQFLNLQKAHLVAPRFRRGIPALLPE